MADTIISQCDPGSQAAVAMSDALWEEIQQRYGFTAPNPTMPEEFEKAPAGFWVAFTGETPVGSIAIKPLREPNLQDGGAELDVMYVAPEFRGTGLARRLLHAAEEHARRHGVTVLRLRAGEPQPEALRFYTKQGFSGIPPFGKWRNDDTARCFEKDLTSAPTSWPDSRT